MYYWRGLYNYQPLYETPTTQKDGLILQNLVRSFGLKHTDLGGIYTLSASPNTYITGNCILREVAQSSGTAYHHDEGSRFYVDSRSVVNVTGNTYGSVLHLQSLMSLVGADCLNPKAADSHMLTS